MIKITIEREGQEPKVIEVTEDFYDDDLAAIYKIVVSRILINNYRIDEYDIP